MDESETPDLCAQGQRSELLAWKRGSVERTVGLPMLKLASGIFSICTWCWAGVHENPQKGMFPCWMREEKKKKKLNGSPLESWKALIQWVKWRLKSLLRRTFLSRPWRSTLHKHMQGSVRCHFIGQLLKAELRSSKPPRGSQKGCPFLTRSLFHLLFPVQKASSNPLNI